MIPNCSAPWFGFMANSITRLSAMKAASPPSISDPYWKLGPGCTAELFSQP